MIHDLRALAQNPPRDWDDEEPFEFEVTDRDLDDDDLSRELENFDLESADFEYGEDDER